VNRVLLLEDHKSFRHHFELVFGERLDHCYTYRQMVEKGGGWEYAFIDFELNDRFTGLGALTYLREFSPETKVIVFTAIGERGRTLFALAAREWFNTWAMLDKGLVDDEILRGVAEGVDPTTPQWQAQLSCSWMINQLFRKPTWLDIWRLWSVYGGSQKAVATASGLSPATVREFGEDALKAVDMLQNQFFATRARVPVKPSATGIGRGNVQRAVPLCDFYQSHANFFDAADLADVLELVEPWSRTS